MDSYRSTCKAYIHWMRALWPNRLTLFEVPVLGMCGISAPATGDLCFYVTDSIQTEVAAIFGWWCKWQKTPGPIRSKVSDPDTCHWDGFFLKWILIIILIKRDWFCSLNHHYQFEKSDVYYSADIQHPVPSTSPLLLWKGQRLEWIIMVRWLRPFNIILHNFGMGGGRL